MTDRADAAEPAGWVLYDGACGICSRWVPFWTPTLNRIGLGTAPLQGEWVIERTGLTPDALARDIRLLHSDGHMTSGPDVYRYVLRRRWWGLPLYAITILPGARQIFNWSYRTFARHRLRISAACGLHPPTNHGI